MLVKGRCYTNLDNFAYEVWPEVFIDTIKEGSLVRSGQNEKLKVIAITHSTYTPTSGIHEPFLEIELGR